MRLYDFHIEDLKGHPFDLSTLQGKKILLVNTASACGYTKQYAQLQDLYKSVGNEKFEIIAFPSNDFGGQEPGSPEEIAAFCQQNYGVTFPIMTKVHTIGNSAHPIFSWLKSETGDEPKWNFHKYLIDKNGNVLRSLASKVEPTDQEILDWIEN